MTVCGIETHRLAVHNLKITLLQQYLPFTVLKQLSDIFFAPSLKLQQCLPFTVLKLLMDVLHDTHTNNKKLQQCLPFTVLKQCYLVVQMELSCRVATVLTVYGIETD